MDPSHEDVLVMANFLIILTAATMLLTNRRNRRCGTRIINRSRNTLGQYHSLFLQMKARDPEQFFKYTRMTVPVFDELLRLLEPQLRRNSHLALSPEHRLAMTLRYLSQGGSMQTVAWYYFVGKATVSKVVNETCKTIWDVLSSLVLRQPTTEMWQEIATGFHQRWNLPLCLGALDGKHVAIQAPKNSGSLWFNYKKSFSMVLLAVCDHNYNFVLIDVGAYGSQSDGGIFELSDFGKRMLEGNLNLPGNTHLPGTEAEFPYFFVADEAFPLKTYMMRPFPGRHLPELQKVFNYRLSRARRCIENPFGILCSRWRIFRSTIIAKESTVQRLILASVCLHNFIKTAEKRLQDRRYCPNNYVDTEDSNGEIQRGQWREEGADENAFTRLGRVGAITYRRIANDLRLILAKYLCSPHGELQFQYRYVNRGRRPM